MSTFASAAPGDGGWAVWLRVDLQLVRAPQCDGPGHSSSLAQHTVHPEAMQRQGLVEAFRRTAGRGLVPILQLMLERREGGEGLVVSGRL